MRGPGEGAGRVWGGCRVGAGRVWGGCREGGCRAGAGKVWGGCTIDARRKSGEVELLYMACSCHVGVVLVVVLSNYCI